MKYNFQKQDGLKDCGVASVSMIIKHYNGFVNHEKLCEMTKTNKKKSPKLRNNEYINIYKYITDKYITVHYSINKYSLIHDNTLKYIDE